jgi:hypothetical protein
MAKNGKNGGAKLIGPMYTAPGETLGPHRVEGPKGGKSVPDPIGLTHGKFATGPGAKSDGSQKHDKS